MVFLSNQTDLFRLKDVGDARTYLQGLYLLHVCLEGYKILEPGLDDVLLAEEGLLFDQLHGCRRQLRVDPPHLLPQLKKLRDDMG